MKPFIATPCYTGDVSIRYNRFMLDLQKELLKLGVEPVFGDIVGSCYLPQVRNELVRMFLKTDCTHLVFVDADMGFDIEGFMWMLSHAEEPKYGVIAVAYPMRVLNWTQIKTIVAGDPDIPADVLSAAGQQWTLKAIDDGEIPLDKPFEVPEIATGGMVIRREVFEGMTDPYFTTGWMDKLDGPPVFQGEDYLFCRRWRAMGGKVWCAPWVRSLHVGKYEFQGDMRMMNIAFDKVG